MSGESVIALARGRCSEREACAATGAVGGTDRKATIAPHPTRRARALAVHALAVRGAVARTRTPVAERSKVAVVAAADAVEAEAVT